MHIESKKASQGERHRDRLPERAPLPFTTRTGLLLLEVDHPGQPEAAAVVQDAVGTRGEVTDGLRGGAADGVDLAAGEAEVAVQPQDPLLLLAGPHGPGLELVRDLVHATVTRFLPEADGAVAHCPHGVQQAAARLGEPVVDEVVVGVADRQEVAVVVHDARALPGGRIVVTVLDCPPRNRSGTTASAEAHAVVVVDPDDEVDAHLLVVAGVAGREEHVGAQAQVVERVELGLGRRLALVTLDLAAAIFVEGVGDRALPHRWWRRGRRCWRHDELDLGHGLLDAALAGHGLRVGDGRQAEALEVVLHVLGAGRRLLILHVGVHVGVARVVVAVLELHHDLVTVVLHQVRDLERALGVDGPVPLGVARLGWLCIVEVAGGQLDGEHVADHHVRRRRVHELHRLAEDVGVAGLEAAVELVAAVGLDHHAALLVHDDPGVAVHLDDEGLVGVVVGVDEVAAGRDQRPVVAVDEVGAPVLVRAGEDQGHVVGVLCDGRRGEDEGEKGEEHVGPPSASG